MEVKHQREAKRRMFQKPTRIPLEHRLLTQILWALRAQRKEDGWIVVSRTLLTRRFLYRRQKETLTPHEFYNRVLPGWIRRGLAREVPRRGKPPLFALRPPTVEEINLRGSELERETERLMVLLEKANTDAERLDLKALYAIIWREMAGIKYAREAAFGEKLDAACSRPPAPPPEKT
jgi:hypothetical protein